MFDDVQPPKSGNTPPNLPIGEPEDIFEAADSTLQPTETALPENSLSVPREPITTINTALDAGVLRPKIESAETSPSTVQPLSSSIPSSSLKALEPSESYTIHTPSAPFLAEERGVMQNQAGVPQEAPFSGRKILMIIITLVILIVIGFGSLWIYTSFIKKNITENNFIPTDTSSDGTSSNPVDTTPDSTVIIPTSTNPEDSILFGEPVDTDSDGILDTDEAGYGTNTLSWDTDL
ncbi:MAG TPA: hypothetical protein PK295_00930, partial [Candidatus Magasanikbacteria bacterium]|nr:hypothetical protein [Candidatus Magasanikbacteria bacterium]